MTDHLPSELELADIDARHQAATPGPWGAYTFGGDTLIEIAADLENTGCGYRARREICRLEDEPLDNDPTHREWTAEEDWAQVRADARFIAHAPEDVGVLLAALRRAHARITAVAALCDAAEGQAVRWDNPLPVPEWVAAVRDAAGLAAAPDAPSAPSTARVGVSPASEAAGNGRGAETAAQGRTGAPGVTGVPQAADPAPEAPDPRTMPERPPTGRTEAQEAPAFVPASVTLAARYTAAGNEMAASLARDGFSADEITNMLADPNPRAHGPQATTTTEEQQ